MSVGFRVLSRERSVSPEQVSRFRGLPVANISDSMGRMSAGGTRLRPYHEGGFMAGAAITVKARPGDNLMLHYALNIAKAGDVIVVDAGGDLTNALIGELMLRFAEKKGLAGIVIDGAIRDLESIEKSSLPVYAAGVTHRGPYKDGPGEVNVPIAIDGMVVYPGDLIVGDKDGVLSIPCDQIEFVYELASKRHRGEIAKLAAIDSGQNDRSWVEAKLKKLGCELI